MLHQEIKGAAEAGRFIGNLTVRTIPLKLATVTFFREPTPQRKLLGIAAPFFQFLFPGVAAVREHKINEKSDLYNTMRNDTALAFNAGFGDVLGIAASLPIAFAASHIADQSFLLSLVESKSLINLFSNGIFGINELRYRRGLTRRVTGKSSYEVHPPRSQF